MEHIRKYCRDDVFARGVFLVGAAHRQAVIDLSKEPSASDSISLQWDFAGHLGQHMEELN
jgi:hypothetical protein